MSYGCEDYWLLGSALERDFGMFNLCLCVMLEAVSCASTLGSPHSSEFLSDWLMSVWMSRIEPGVMGFLEFSSAGEERNLQSMRSGLREG
ncbi:hypothetical protein E2C01_003791 [Portunus trituberculatus]|uniref:Uncharacterized protein n=1 Tax=Portunus trituberculatus TaxID=210409 RepID=A0A5B7CUH4_PORTR|nr:hypothetical protein [Portunus trituberculatus]